MSGRWPGAGLLACAACAAFGQATPAGPTFEVASVKPAAPVTGLGPRRISSSDPAQVAYRNVGLRFLIMTAYQVQAYQIVEPEWLASERYDVAAKLPENASTAQVPLMLQALLAERFKLVLHHEQKITPGYALAAAKGGFKLKPVAQPGDEFNVSRGALIELKGRVTLGALANALAILLGSPVEDITRMEGTFDIDLEWSPDDREAVGSRFTAGGETPAPAARPDAPPDAPSGPSIFAALEGLGLKLESRRAPLDILVIDHAEKAPVEN